MFTDIVDSTKLVEALGEEKWQKLLAWHDRTLRELIEEAGGEVIKQTGDGYFAAFESPAAAVEAAVAIQRALDGTSRRAGRAHRRPRGRRVREGRGRLRRAGRARGRADRRARRRRRDPRQLGQPRRHGDPLPGEEPRSEELKGFAEPVEIAEIAWR